MINFFNKNFINLFNCLILFALFFYSYALQEKSTIIWNVNYWLFDYSFGFMRRGFLGFLFEPFHKNNLEILNLIYLALVFLLALVVILLQTFRENKIIFPIQIFIFTCPLLVKNIIYDWLRPDLIGFIFIFFLILNYRRRIFKYLIFLSLIILPLVSDVFLFISSPLIFYLIYEKYYFDNNSDLFSLKSIKFLLLISLFYIFNFVIFNILFKGPVNISSSSYFYYLQGKIPSVPLYDSTYIFFKNISEQVELTKSFRQNILYEFYSYYFLITLSYILIFITFILTFISNKFKAFLLFLFITIPFIFLFIVANDYLRWISCYLWNIVALLIHLRVNKSTFIKTEYSKNTDLFFSRFLLMLSALSFFISAFGVQYPNIIKSTNLLIP
jgi:hypothetical protein